MTPPTADPASDRAGNHSAGPSPIGERRQTRLFAALALIGCGSVLGVAAWLQPDARGFGTHQQLGFAPCGMILATGLPCPTCGMTTAFSNTMHGHWLRAFWSQPAGFMLALGAIAAVFVSGFVLVTGRRPRWPLGFVSPFVVFSSLLGLLVFGWGWKLFVGLATGELPVHRLGS